jgi:APA family basic amino acid/polyamine antiporter
VFTFVKVAIILSIVVIGLGYSGGNWQNFAGSFTGAKGGMTGFVAALVAALWAYDGWNDLNMVSEKSAIPSATFPVR